MELEEIFIDLEPYYPQDEPRMYIRCNVVKDCFNQYEYMLPSKNPFKPKIRACEKHKKPHMLHKNECYCKHNMCLNSAVYYDEYSDTKEIKYCEDHYRLYQKHNLQYSKFPILSLNDYKADLKKIKQSLRKNTLEVNNPENCAHALMCNIVECKKFATHFLPTNNYSRSYSRFRVRACDEHKTVLMSPMTEYTCKRCDKIAVYYKPTSEHKRMVYCKKHANKKSSYTKLKKYTLAEFKELLSQGTKFY